MIKTWLRWIGGDRPRPHRQSPRLHRGPRRRRLGLEQVEGRLLLSALGNRTWSEDGFVDLLRIEVDCGAVYCESYGATKVVTCAAGSALGRWVTFNDASSHRTFDSHALPAANDVEPIRLVPDEWASYAPEGGLIDLTRVLNESVRPLAERPGGQQDRAGAIVRHSDREGSAGVSADHPSTGDLRGGLPGFRSATSVGESVPRDGRSADAGLGGSPFDRIDGSRGVSQAFELAISPQQGPATVALELDPEGLLAHGSRADQSARPGGSSHDPQPDRQSADPRTSHDLRPALLDHVLGRVQPSASGPQFPWSSLTTVLLGQLPLADSASHEAVFAEMAGPFGDALSDAVYLENRRPTDVVPLLAVAIVSGHLAQRQGDAHDKSWGRVLYPLRRPPFDRSP